MIKLKLGAPVAEAIAWARQVRDWVGPDMALCADANWAYDVADAAWARFWWIYLVVHLVISAVTTVWFVIGGTHGMLDLYRRLRTLKPDDRDDGRVEGGN